MGNDNETLRKLNDFLTLHNEETLLSEFMLSSFTVRNGITVYFKDEWGFKHYIDELYRNKNIEKYYYSKEEFTNLIIDNYIYFNSIQNYESNLVRAIERIEKKDFHVLLPIFYLHMLDAELVLGINKFIRFQALGSYFKESNYCVPNGIDKITSDGYFANVPFFDIVVEARDFHFAFDLAQLRLEEIIHLLNFILYSNIRGMDVISSTTNSGTRARHFIICKDWCQTSASGHPANVKQLVLEDVLDFILNEENGNKQLIDIFDKKNKNEIERRITNAVNWLGMAIAEKNNSIAFTQAIYAIESLLQYDTKGEVINKSIVATISEAVAFLLGKNFEDRKSIEKKFKELYGIRSKIAHGKSSEITAYQVLEAIDLAKRLVQELLTNSALKDASTMQKISNYITKLKYTVVNDTENN